MQRGYRNAAIVAVALVLLIFALSPLPLERLERAMISTGPNGPETPAAAGLAHERLKIPSGSRLLDAYLVEVPSTCQSRAALFIFHGVGEIFRSGSAYNASSMTTAYRRLFSTIPVTVTAALRGQSGILTRTRWLLTRCFIRDLRRPALSGPLVSPWAVPFCSTRTPYFIRRRHA